MSFPSFNYFIVVDFQQFAKFSTCHCFFHRDFLFESFKYRGFVFLVKRTKMCGNGIANVARVPFDEPVNSLMFGTCLLSVKNVSIFEFNYVAALFSASSLEHHKVRLGTRKIERATILHLLLSNQTNAVFHYFLFQELIKVQDIGNHVCDHTFQFVARRDYGRLYFAGQRSQFWISKQPYVGAGNILGRCISKSCHCYPTISQPKKVRPRWRAASNTEYEPAAGSMTMSPSLLTASMRSP